MVGSLALATNDNAGARAAWQRALAIDPDNIDALAGMAALLTAAKKPHEARAFIEARLAKQPDRQGLLLLAGKVRLAAGDLKAAETALKHLVEIAPQDLQGYALLGQMFVRGAFAGTAPATSFQVVAGSALNPPASIDRGRLIVELRVAPSLPLTFLTVRLVQTGDRRLIAQES